MLQFIRPTFDPELTTFYRLSVSTLCSPKPVTFARQRRCFIQLILMVCVRLSVSCSPFIRQPFKNEKQKAGSEAPFESARVRNQVANYDLPIFISLMHLDARLFLEYRFFYHSARKLDRNARACII